MILSTKFLRLFLLPLGLLLKLYQIAVTGARDIHNKIRFRNSSVDRGCCINQSSMIETNCHILENTIILNSQIKRFSYIGRNSIVQNASIGSFCSIANDVFIGLGTHPTDYFSTSPLFYRQNNTFNINLINQNEDFEEYRPIKIGNDVWIGSRAIVLDGVVVGDGAIIATQSVVTKDVPPYSIVAGVPAKIIRNRFSPEKVELLLKLEWWSWPISTIQKHYKYFKEM